MTGKIHTCHHCKSDITEQCEAYHAEKIRERASKAGRVMTEKRRASLAKARAAKKNQGREIMTKVHENIYLRDDAVVIDIEADCTCHYQKATYFEPEQFDCNDDGDFLVIDQELPRWADFGRFDSLIERLTGECPHVEDAIYQAIAEGGVVWVVRAPSAGLYE